MRILGTGLMMLFVLAIAFAHVIIHNTTQETVTFTVERSERVTSGETSRYMVWGAKPIGGVEVFENTDSWLAFKFNSADIYGRMSMGAECTATVVGFRVPFLSMNRNILSADCKQQG